MARTVKKNHLWILKAMRMLLELYHDGPLEQVRVNSLSGEACALLQALEELLRKRSDGLLPRVGKEPINSRTSHALYCRLISSTSNSVTAATR